MQRIRLKNKINRIIEAYSLNVKSAFKSLDRFLLTFGSHVSNIDFIKVLEIEFIFFYFIFGMVNVKVLVTERLHSMRVAYT